MSVGFVPLVSLLFVRHHNYASTRPNTIWLYERMDVRVRSDIQPPFAIVSVCLDDEIDHSMRLFELKGGVDAAVRRPPPFFLERGWMGSLLL